MKLEHYGFIGDTHTGALVGNNGSIDWLCTPRFDSEACFAALLGDENNGHWKIAPTAPVTHASQTYREDTMILHTEMETAEGAIRLIDFMPPDGSYRDVVRIVRGVRGKVAVEMKLTIRFNYGKTVPWVQQSDQGLTAIAGPNALILRSTVGTHGENLSTVARFTVSEGEERSFVLTWHPSHTPAPAAVDPLNSLKSTEQYWRAWSSQCTYQGKYREAVMRSLLTLKVLTYAPTGGIVAAATTSLPEQLGGVRNWDYRYCWLRDATFTLYSLMQAGYKDEAIAWREWLLRAAAGDPAQLQIMYGAAGEQRMLEYTLPHLKGYENSAPVRVGNAAAEQMQLDVYGEVMDAMHVARTVGIQADRASWPLQRHLVDFVEAHWNQPDEGIWEIRGPRRQFTHSKIMAWVAVDRAIKAVEDYGLDGPLEHWKTLRTTIHTEVCTAGYNQKRKAFTQYYGSDELDASLLMAPLVGFLPITDERIISTIELIQKELVVDGFVLRYHTHATGDVDGLPPGEGAFLPCSFWLVDCLHLLNREKEASEMFERLLETRTPLGLLAEEYDQKQQRLVGNFPQAFSHVALINTARNLSPKAGPADLRSTHAPF